MLNDSKEFWDDNEWSLEHATEISKRYPNQWVAIVDKQIIAAGKNAKEVGKVTIRKSGRKEFVIYFAEQGFGEPYALLS